MRKFRDENSAHTFRRWHEFVETPNLEILHEILADEVKFHSPFVWKPKLGKEITIRVLIAATKTFQDFRYVREVTDGNHWALEFEARIGEFSLRGIDLIEVNEAGKIIDFEVMIRPANALQKLGAEMNRRLIAENSE
jgi:hypothetical protein